MDYKLWGNLDSGSFMVEAALAEAGQTVELVDLDFENDEQHDPAFLQINSSGKVPALRFPDGEILVQSTAILLALAEEHPEALLLPAQGAPDRRFALRWLIQIEADIYPFIEAYDYPQRFSPPESSEVGVRSQVRQRLRERWKMVDAAAADNGSFLLSGFSVIDLAIAIISGWAVGAEWRARECPKLAHIAATVSTRDKVIPVWKRHFDRGEG